jgi:hypothetical protein
MDTSIAIGGPRDGVKITADASWDGRVRHPPGHRSITANPTTLFYFGRYIWEDTGWTWVAEESEPYGRRYVNGATSQKY